MCILLTHLVGELTGVLVKHINLHTKFNAKLKKILNGSALTVVLAILLLSFQNCTQAGDIKLEGELLASSVSNPPVDVDTGDSETLPGTNPGGSDSPQNPSHSDDSGVITTPNEVFPTETTLVYTEMNTPVSFILQHGFKKSGLSFNVKSENPIADVGLFEIIDSNEFKFKYTPKYGFRGKETAKVVVSDSKGILVSTLYVIATVGNPVLDIRPSLAIRGMGCIQCHANIKSNVITDFGLGSKYYFGVNHPNVKWDSGAVYGDHSKTFNSINLPSDASIFIPKADLPSEVALDMELDTIYDYIKDRFFNAVNESTKSAKIVEAKSIYIGAPNPVDIVNAFKLSTNQKFKYYKNASDSIDLSGLNDRNKFFEINGNFQCDGDLAIRGPVLIQNMNLITNSGCRLYIIGSVFMYGAIKYTSTNNLANLQITSSSSINLGLGNVVKNNKFCEANTRWENESSEKSYEAKSSLYTRLRDIWALPAFYVRANSDPVQFHKAIVNEAATIQSISGEFYDAACTSAGRNVSFEKLLLNSPIINSRYYGNFSGTIISEFAIMSLGKFEFTFDSIFTKVPILPFFDPKIYLSVQEK